MEAGAPAQPAAWVPLCAAAYAGLGGTATLLGWFLDVPRLTDWNGNGISQMPNNALGVVFCGAALLLLVAGQSRLCAALGGFAALIGAATLLEYGAGVDLGIDRLLVYREWGQRGALVPGRMGVPGATSLTLAGTGLALAAFARMRRWAAVCASLVIAIAALSLTGYLFGADPLYTLPRITTISLQTSSMMLALGIGIAAAVPDANPVKHLLGASASAALLRRVLPGSVLLPLAAGWLALAGLQADLFDPAFAVALLVLVLIGSLVLLLLWSAAGVRAHEQALDESRTRLAGILDGITDAYMVLGPDWKFVYVNGQARQRIGTRARSVIGENLWEVFPEAVGTEAHRQLHRAMGERVSVDYELFFEPWQRWFSDRAYPLPDGGIAILSRDVTERVQAQARIRDAEERLRLAISIADGGTWDLDLVTAPGRKATSLCSVTSRPPTAVRRSRCGRAPSCRRTCPACSPRWSAPPPRTTSSARNIACGASTTGA